MSPRWNWDSPTPSLASECAPPPGTKGGGALSPAGEGLGESQFRRLEKKLNTLPTLWLKVSQLKMRGLLFEYVEQEVTRRILWKGKNKINWRVKYLLSEKQMYILTLAVGCKLSYQVQYKLLISYKVMNLLDKKPDYVHDFSYPHYKKGWRFSVPSRDVSLTKLSLTENM
jgi:hypothetical protein